MTDNLDRSETDLLEQDELVSYAVQVGRCKLDNTFGRRDIITEGCIPVLTIPFVFSLLFYFIPGIPSGVPVFLYIVTSGLLPFILFHRLYLRIERDADLATYRVRPDFVDVLQKLAMNSDNPKKKKRFQRRIKLLTTFIHSSDN
jgi:hypothetical protein